MTAFEDFVTEEVLKGRSIIGLYPATHEQTACRLRRLAQGQRPMSDRARNFIAGEWVAAAETSADINPSNTGDVLGQYPQASAADAERAIAAAQDAFPAWSRSTPQLRHDILKRIGDELLARKDEIGAILSREEGKPLAEGIGETVRAAQIFLFFSGEALRLTGDKLASVRPGVDIEITREPVGVVGMICPWNFPIAIPAWKTAPALAYGNCVVLKPAELVPATATALAEIIARAGVPPGVFNLVIGRGSVVGRGDAAPSGRERDLVHRLGRDRAPGGRDLHRVRPDEEGAAGDGRQEPARRAGRCRPRERGRDARSTAPTSRPASAAPHPRA